MITVGLIGAGGIAGAHLRGYLQIPDHVRVAAVADVNTEQAALRAEESGGAEVFADFHQMISAAQIDAVDICLPHHLHVEAILAAASAGKHILCEKPLCLTVAEAELISRAVADNGVTLMCAHNQLYMPPVAKAREMIAGGELGTIYEVRTTDSFFNNFDPQNMGWRANRATSGGGELIDTGYHPTYLLLRLAQAEPVEVTAMLSTHRLKFSEGEDSAQVLVRFADGSVGNIVTSWAYQPAGSTERFSAVGEKGSVWSDGRTLFHRMRGGETQQIEFEPVDTFVAEIADFVGCLRDQRRPIDTDVEGTRVLKVILGAYASAESKRTIILSDL